MESFEKEFKVKCIDCSEKFPIKIQVIEDEKGVKSCEVQCLFCGYEQTISVPNNLSIVPDTTTHREIK